MDVVRTMQGHNQPHDGPLVEHVHDDTLNCLACYYGEPPQFSRNDGRRR